MLTQAQLIDLFVAAGAPPAVFGPFGKFQLPDRAGETCSREFVQASFNDLLDSLPPECIATRPIGGGKSVRVLRHTMAGGDLENEAGDCDTHSLVVTAHCAVGNWRKSLRTGTRRGGLWFGFLDYLAIAKPGDGRAGGHSRNWFVTPAHTLEFFEPGDNAFPAMLREELASLFGGRAV